MHFADKAFVAETTAKMLLEVKAVLFFSDKPFIFTSGWASPVYIDCRKLIFYPRIRTQLVDFAAGMLARDVGFEQFDVVAGGETAGIPYAAWIADRLGLPMQYVRKKPKGFGRNAQIEGDVREGARTLLVEDLTTDGRSKINFCPGAAHRRRDRRPRVRQLLLRHLSRVEEDPRRPEREAALPRDLVGHPRGGEEGRLPRRRSRSPKWRASCTRRRKWSAAHGGVSAFPSSS